MLTKPGVLAWLPMLDMENDLGMGLPRAIVGVRDDARIGGASWLSFSRSSESASLAGFGLLVGTGCLLGSDGRGGTCDSRPSAPLTMIVGDPSAGGSTVSDTPPKLDRGARRPDGIADRFGVLKYLELLDRIRLFRSAWTSPTLFT
eukprot:scaffold8210_cov258-Pinguiococcus_pyrenoidosus.AAC.4